MPVLDAILACIILVNVLVAGVGVECGRKLAARFQLVSSALDSFEIRCPGIAQIVRGFTAIWDRFLASSGHFEVRFAVFCDQLGDFFEELFQSAWDSWEKAFQPGPEDRAYRLRRVPVRRVSTWDLQHGVGKLQQRTCAICLEDWVHAEQIRELPPCTHAFHMRCVDDWLATWRRCPTCRARIGAVR